MKSLSFLIQVFWMCIRSSAAVHGVYLSCNTLIKLHHHVTKVFIANIAYSGILQIEQNKSKLKKYLGNTKNHPRFNLILRVIP